MAVEIYANFQCTYSYSWQGRDVWNRDAYGIVNVEKRVCCEYCVQYFGVFAGMFAKITIVTISRIRVNNGLIFIL